MLVGVDQAALLSEFARAKGLASFDDDDAPLRQLEAHHELSVHVEHCTCVRPSHHLRGSRQKYLDRLEALKQALHPLAAEGVLVVLANVPDFAGLEGARDQWESPIKRRRPGSAPLPPRPFLPRAESGLDSARGRWPRVGAFEVSYALTNTTSKKRYGPFPCFSKIQSGMWPRDASVVSRIEAALQRLLLQDESDFALEKKVREQMGERMGGAGGAVWPDMTLVDPDADDGAAGAAGAEAEQTAGKAAAGGAAGESVSCARPDAAAGGSQAVARTVARRMSASLLDEAVAANVAASIGASAPREAGLSASAAAAEAAAAVAEPEAWGWGDAGAEQGGGTPTSTPTAADEGGPASPFPAGPGGATESMNGSPNKSMRSMRSLRSYADDAFESESSPRLTDPYTFDEAAAATSSTLFPNTTSSTFDAGATKSGTPPAARVPLAAAGAHTVVVVGPPGEKATAQLCAALVPRLGGTVLSVRALVAAEMVSPSAEGRELHALQSAGQTVPEATLLRLLLRAMGGSAPPFVLFDWPRTAAQLRKLEAAVGQVASFLQLPASHDRLAEAMLNTLRQSGRVLRLGVHAVGEISSASLADEALEMLAELQPPPDAAPDGTAADTGAAAPAAD